MLRNTFVLGRLVFHFNLFVALCVVAVAAGFVRLGLWQLDRAEEKLTTQSSFVEKGMMPPRPIDYVRLAGPELDAIHLQNQPVSLKGHYLNERSLYLIYQTHEEQLGFEVVTPFKLVTRDEIVLVSRGWTGAPDYDRLKQRLPAIQGEQLLDGQIYVPRAAEMARKNDVRQVQWPLLIRFLNVAELQPFFASPLFPYAVRLNEGEAGVLVRHWSEVQVDTGRNYSYALQWFAMAIAVITASLLLSSNLLSLLGVRSRSS
jgi:surfeit locus 1 family protein